MSLAERFNLRVCKGPGCWEWTGPLTKGGYGQFIFKGVWKKAHRWAYEIFKGIIPCGMCVLHLCDNPCCVNPDHLRLGTQRDNVQDCVSKNRHARHERMSNAKINMEIASKIRELYRPHIFGIKRLAKHFGISLNIVRRVLGGIAWK